MGKKSDALFVAFYDMRAVTLFLSNETADVSIGGTVLVLIPRLNHTESHRQVIPGVPNPIYIEKKI